MTTARHDPSRQLQGATAVGGVLILAFWTLYFAANETLGLIDPAYAAFEESFIVADAVLAVLLFATSVSLRRRRVAGPFMLAMAASMCLYLGILDVTFYARNGLFLPFSSAASIQLLVNCLCVGGGCYGLWGAWRMWRAP